MDRLTLDDRLPANATAELADRLVEALANGASVLLTGPADPTPLFAAAARHPRLLRTTVFQVGPPLDLVSMLRQVTIGADLKDTTLEQGFRSLVAPKAGCERVVLFVTEAHLLPDATMRYIEFALHAGPHLTVVLAGQDEFLDMMALDGFARLRTRIPVHLMLPDAGAANTNSPLEVPMPRAAGRSPTYRMTPPRLLASAAGAAGLAILGIMSFSIPAPTGTAGLARPGAASSAAAIATPEPASTQPAPVAVAAVPTLGTSAIAAQQAPVAAPPPSTATKLEPALAAAAPAASRTVTVNASDVPHGSVPASTPEMAGPMPDVSSHADTAGVANTLAAQHQTAWAGASGLLPGSTPESNPEVAEAPAESRSHPAIPSEPPAPIPSQVDAPDPEMVAAPTAEPAVGPANTVGILPPAT